MSTSATVTNQDNLLFRMYGDKLRMPLLKASKFVNKMKKDTNFRGADRTVHVEVAPTGGGSSSFEGALASAKETQTIRFVVTRRTEYQVFNVQGHVIAASRGNKGAMLQILGNESKSARYAYARSVATKAKRGGGGSLFRLDTTTTLASTTAILRDATDAVGVEAGMQLEWSTDDGTAASPAGVLGSPTYLTVVSVNNRGGDNLDTTLTMPARTESPARPIGPVRHKYHRTYRSRTARHPRL
jgi:hypothetical protein